MDGVIARGLTKDDIGFLFSSFLQSSYYGDYSIHGRIRLSVFKKHHRRVMESVLRRKDTRVIVACMPDDPSVIFGYVIYAANKLFWIYVKDAFRKKGIGRFLWESAGLPTTGDSVVETAHWTNVGAAIIKKHPNLTVHNPYILHVEN